AIVRGAVSDIVSGLRNGENAFEVLADTALRALDRITDKLLNDVLDAVLMFKSETSSGSSGGGFLSGIGDFFGELFSGFFATGGLIPSGTFGIVGERGPEPVIGTSRGAMVLPNSSLRGAQGAGVTVNVINNADGTEARERRRTDGDGREIVDVVIERVRESFASGGFDAANAARYGISPRRVRR
ncbi:hypothetical protein H2509_04120, partial [Stappia sp. F7233]|nr:hypothetical protein [Stappia albiluteola]MBA5776308.1 hypothetical protein [Stappia albiluteola]